MKTLSSLIENALEDILIEYAQKKGLDPEEALPYLVEAILNRKGLVKIASDFPVYEAGCLYDLIPEVVLYGENLIYKADISSLSIALEKCLVVFFAATMEYLGEKMICEELELRE